MVLVRACQDVASAALPQAIRVAASSAASWPRLSWLVRVCDGWLIGYRLEDRPDRIREESGTSKCIRLLVVLVVKRAAAIARYLRHAKSTYMDSYVYKVKY